MLATIEVFPHEISYISMCINNAFENGDGMFCIAPVFIFYFGWQLRWLPLAFILSFTLRGSKSRLIGKHNLTCNCDHHTQAIYNLLHKRSAYAGITNTHSLTRTYRISCRCRCAPA